MAPPTKSSTAFMNAHEAKRRIALGFLPLGTGNSFLRDFTKEGANASLQALIEGRTRAVDLVRLTHAEGEVYSFNLLSLGFTADVGALTNRYFKPFGYLGYLLGVFVRVVQLRRARFVCVATMTKIGREPLLFLTFNNSKFTGGTMLIAPQADPTDGLIEFVRWGPIGRLGLLRMASEALRRHAHRTSTCFAPLRPPRRIWLESARRRAHRRRNCSTRVRVPQRDSFRRGHLYMKRAVLTLRSAFLWILSGMHFFVVAPTLVFLGIFLDPRKHGWLHSSAAAHYLSTAQSCVKVSRACAGPEKFPERQAWVRRRKNACR